MNLVKTLQKQESGSTLEIDANIAFVNSKNSDNILQFPGPFKIHKIDESIYNVRYFGEVPYQMLEITIQTGSCWKEGNNCTEVEVTKIRRSFPHEIHNMLKKHNYDLVQIYE